MWLFFEAELAGAFFCLCMVTSASIVQEMVVGLGMECIRNQ